MANTTKLSRKMIAEIVEMLKLRMTWTQIAEAIGVTVQTLKNWRNQGYADHDNGVPTIYRKLVDAIDTAKASSFKEVKYEASVLGLIDTIKATQTQLYNAQTRLDTGFTPELVKSLKHTVKTLRTLQVELFKITRTELIDTINKNLQRCPDVYFIQGEITQRIKIGISYNPKRRTKDIEASELLKLLAVIKEGGIETEKKLHERFKHLRLRGEWFKSDKEIFAFINNLNR